MNIEQLCREAKAASRVLATLTRSTEGRGARTRRRGARPAARRDPARRTPRTSRLARTNRLAEAFVDRLLLDEDRLADMVAGVRDIARLPDPVGEVERGYRLPNGLELQRLRAPLGVVAIVYEARPNVTVDAAALCHQDGQRRDPARRQRRQAHATASSPRWSRGRCSRPGLPAAGVAFLGGDRELLARAGAASAGRSTSSSRAAASSSRTSSSSTARCRSSTPPAATATSTSTRAADLADALAIVVNAKCQRPGVCNAAETLLVHRDVAAAFLPERRSPSCSDAASSWSSTRRPPRSSRTHRSSAPTARTTRPSS